MKLYEKDNSVILEEIENFDDDFWVEENNCENDK